MDIDVIKKDINELEEKLLTIRRSL